MNAKILICCHKESSLPKSDLYLPIQVGKGISNIDLGMQGDNTGDNISHKNASYCELTGMYWAWKNLQDVDVIGLCHYRRYFDFYGACGLIMPSRNFRTSVMDMIDFTVPNEILQSVMKNTIIVPKREYCLWDLATEYCRGHVSDDFRVLQDVFIRTQTNDFVNAFNKIMYANNAFIPYNMFIMSWQHFDEYCLWLFPILEEVERQIDICHYNMVQRRVFGYMAERLFNVYIKAMHLEEKSKPIIKISNDYNSYSSCHFLINRVRGTIATWLTRSKSKL